MPRIQKREDNRLKTKDLVEELREIGRLSEEIRKRTLHLWVVFYTRGISDRGPIAEDRDDIPF